MTTKEQEEQNRKWCFELKPVGYLPPDRIAPGIKGKLHVVHVGRAERILAPPAPEPCSPDLTGRYQDGAALGVGEGPQFLMHINQTGRHMEGMMVLVPDDGSKVAEHRFWGEVEGGPLVKLTLFEDGEFIVGKLTQGGDYLMVEVPLKGFPALLSFRMREPTSSFLDSALQFALDANGGEGEARSESDELVRSAEVAPLTSAKMQEIREALDTLKLAPLIQKFSAHTSSVKSSESVALEKSIEALDVEVGKALGEKQIPSQLRPQAFDFARMVLLQQPQRVNGVLKSQLQWTEDMVSRAYALHYMRPNIPTLLQLLGRTAGGANAKAFEYEISLDLKIKRKGLKGFGLNGFLYYGKVTVKAVGRSLWNREHRQGDTSDTVTYDAYLAGVGVVVGKGGVSGLKGTAKVATIEDWVPSDFLGEIRVLAAGAQAGTKVLGADAGYGAKGASLVLIGSGTHRRLIIEIPWDVGRRGGMGAEASFGFGAIVSDANLKDQDYSRKPVSFKLPVRFHDNRDVHFRFGSAILEKSGRNLIRKFCAEWLRWVESDQSNLRVVGHADSVDTYERNIELSRLRADNVIQAMKDVLGNKLRIPQDQIKTQPWGECDAYFHGEQDLPNRMFRRVDVLLDGCCVLTLWGA
jgi:outer membrane protein OmpA-like peptidoglycan-associated protein